jgi:spore germination protein
MQIHVVQAGETLGSIAAQYGVSVRAIVNINQLPNPNQLSIGQALIIPAPGQIHIVQPGETLGTIARRYNTTVGRITRLNAIENPDLIYIGQRLLIPAPAGTYVIQPGDTLWKIANMFAVTVDSIISENRITNPSLIYPGQTILIPRPVIEVNGYLTRTGAQGQAVVRELGEYLTYLSMFSYKITAEGGLIPMNETDVLEVARQQNVSPLLVITNFSGRRFSSELANTLLTNEALQQTLLTNIINTMREKQYRGLNIDFEYVFPSDRENYNNFLRLTVERLRPLGFLVSTALAPKERADQPGLLYEAHDYPVHGELTDFVVLMTYEWGYAAGPPWAIAPINKVRDVLNYAVTVIPRNKILMGAPTYGRDWKLPFVQGTTIASTVSPPEAVARAYRYGAIIQYNTLYQAPFYYYINTLGVRHVVWYEDARSAQAKFNTVKQYGLRGISYWELSVPFPQNWVVLENNFRVAKL